MKIYLDNKAEKLKRKKKNQNKSNLDKLLLEGGVWQHLEVRTEDQMRQW